MADCSHSSPHSLSVALFIPIAYLLITYVYRFFLFALNILIGVFFKFFLGPSTFWVIFVEKSRINFQTQKIIGKCLLRPKTLSLRVAPQGRLPEPQNHFLNFFILNGIQFVWTHYIDYEYFTLRRLFEGTPAPNLPRGLT